MINLATADQPRDMSVQRLGVWKLVSPDNKHMLEQSIEVQDGVHVASWKVVEQDSGKLVWSGRPKLIFVPFINEVYLAPGGMNVGVIDRYLYFRGQKEDVGKQKLLWIFHQSELKQDYAIKDFGMSEVEIERIKRSVSHLHAFPKGIHFVTPHFPEYIDSSKDKPKLFGGDSTSFFVTFRCGLQVTISFDTQKIIGSKRLISESDFLTIGEHWYK